MKIQQTFFLATFFLATFLFLSITSNIFGQDTLKNSLSNTKTRVDYDKFIFSDYQTSMQDVPYFFTGLNIFQERFPKMDFQQRKVYNRFSYEGVAEYVTIRLCDRGDGHIFLAEMTVPTNLGKSKMKQNKQDLANFLDVVYDGGIDTYDAEDLLEKFLIDKKSVSKKLIESLISIEHDKINHRIILTIQAI